MDGYQILQWFSGKSFKIRLGGYSSVIMHLACRRPWIQSPAQEKDKKKKKKKRKRKKKIKRKFCGPLGQRKRRAHMVVERASLLPQYPFPFLLCHTSPQLCSWLP
jgi:hypothetical protein